MNAVQAYALAKAYTNETAIEFGGLKGASAQIESINKSGKQNTVTFQWENSAGQTREAEMIVNDGLDGKGIVSISKTGTSGLTDVYTILFTDDSVATFTVTNGARGLGIRSTAIDSEGHLIIIYDNNIAEDAGLLPVHSVTVNQIQETGTKIAEIEVNGVTTNIFAPSGSGGGAEVAARLEKAEASIAPLFNPAQAYAVGTNVIYADELYKFTTAHVANTPWDRTEVDKKTVEELIDDAEPEHLTTAQLNTILGLIV